MQAMAYELAPGRTSQGTEVSKMRKQPRNDVVTGGAPAWPDPAQSSGVEVTPPKFAPP